MAEYIDREAAMRAVLGESTDAHYPEWYAAILMELPTADVTPVVHGKWIHYPDCGVTRCSHCGWSIEECWESKRCPDCGCRMDGGDNDEAD